jgi:hypothetical protein
MTVIQPIRMQNLISERFETGQAEDGVKTPAVNLLGAVLRQVGAYG